MPRTPDLRLQFNLAHSRLSPQQVTLAQILTLAGRGEGDCPRCGQSLSGTDLPNPPRSVICFVVSQTAFGG